MADKLSARHRLLKTFETFGRVRGVRKPGNKWHCDEQEAVTLLLEDLLVSAPSSDAFETAMATARRRTNTYPVPPPRLPPSEREPFVSVDTCDGEAVILISRAEGEDWPLTAAGCRDAGRWLRQNSFSNWLCSSSVDFPHDYKPGTRIDVRARMMEGWDRENRDIVASATATLRAVVRHAKAAGVHVPDDQRLDELTTELVQRLASDSVALAKDLEDPSRGHWGLLHDALECCAEDPEFEDSLSETKQRALRELRPLVAARALPPAEPPPKATETPQAASWSIF